MIQKINMILLMKHYACNYKDLNYSDNTINSILNKKDIFFPKFIKQLS